MNDLGERFTWVCSCCCRWISWSDVDGVVFDAFVHGADCWLVADRDLG